MLDRVFLVGDRHSRPAHEDVLLLQLLGLMAEPRRELDRECLASIEPRCTEPGEEPFDRANEFIHIPRAANAQLQSSADEMLLPEPDHICPADSFQTFPCPEFMPAQDPTKGVGRQQLAR